MRKIFTIGFTRMTAEEFFTTLEDNGVRKVVDVSTNPNFSASANIPTLNISCRRF